MRCFDRYRNQEPYRVDIAISYNNGEFYLINYPHKKTNNNFLCSNVFLIRHLCPSYPWEKHREDIFFCKVCGYEKHFKVKKIIEDYEYKLSKAIRNDYQIPEKQKMKTGILNLIASLEEEQTRFAKISQAMSDEGKTSDSNYYKGTMECTRDIINKLKALINEKIEDSK